MEKSTHMIARRLRGTGDRVRPMLNTVNPPRRYTTKVIGRSTTVAKDHKIGPLSNDDAFYVWASGLHQSPEDDAHSELETGYNNCRYLKIGYVRSYGYDTSRSTQLHQLLNL